MYQIVYSLYIYDSVLLTTNTDAQCRNAFSVKDLTLDATFEN
jgi:hypothetical protein